MDSMNPPGWSSVPSPFDGAPVFCTRYRAPCDCEYCDPERHAADRAKARVRVMQAMLDVLPPHVADAWRKQSDGGKRLAVAGDERYFMAKARAVPRDSDARHVVGAIRALADALERML